LKELRIGSGDPGGLYDSFGFVLTKYVPSIRGIYVLGAHEWKFADGQIDYPGVEEAIVKIHGEQALDYFVCEKNNTGVHVIQSLKNNYHIPVYGVTTASRIKSDKVIRKGDTMDKAEHVGWINKKRQSGQILFPKKKTKGIMTLESQLNSFVRETTPGGTVRYLAEGQGHDDLVMALMVNTYFLRRKVMREGGLQKRVTLSKKYTRNDSNDPFGSGIPSGAKLLGRTMINP
jgi:hypothetical protein